MNKIIFSIILIFCFGLIQAQGLEYKVGEEANITIVCVDSGVGYCSPSSYCNINVEDPNGNLIVTNENLTNEISYHYLTINLTEIGKYYVSGFCLDGAYTKEIDFHIISTYTGQDNSNVWANIIIMLFFAFLLIGVMYLNRHTNYEAWYNSMVKQYYFKNFVKFSLSAIGYNLMKRTFIMYYLIGFPLIVMLLNITAVYNISMLYVLMQNLMYVYVVGFLLVGIVFLSYVQEFTMDMIENVQKLSWGLLDEK